MGLICLTRPIPSPGPQLLRDSGHEVRVNIENRPMRRREFLETVRGCGGLLTQLQDVVDAELMDAAGPELRVVSNFAVGYNNINVPEATRRGILVYNTPGVLTEATADIAWLLLMGVARRVHEGESRMRSGERWEWGPEFLVGGDLCGKTLAIIGAGRIGFAVARRAKAWDMRIVYTARTAHEDFERELGAIRMEPDAALATADFVSLHVPLSAETHHLIDAKRLAMMKPTAYLINTSRGSVVDEVALVAALKNRTIAGAGLDVYENEPQTAPGLLDCPNTFLLPHLGSATQQTRAAMAELSVKNLLAVLAGNPTLHAVNAV